MNKSWDTFRELWRGQHVGWGCVSNASKAPPCHPSCRLPQSCRHLCLEQSLGELQTISA